MSAAASSAYLKDEAPDNFSSFLISSLVAHVVIVFIFTVKAFLIPQEGLILPDAIRVDIVALPEKSVSKAELPPAPPKPVEIPQQKPAVKPPLPEAPKMDLKKLHTKQKEAMDRLKVEDSITNIMKEMDRAAERPKSQPIKGNVTSPGNSLTGVIRLQYNEYLSELQRRVKTQWNLPQFLADANLKAQALVIIDERGYIVRKEIISTSGNPVFDQTVLSAIEKSSPVPEPPGQLKDILGANGAIFNFP